ncbi:2-oxoacid:acceptor oxidoreductase family protein [Zhaonella formicivorans]|uniref:2-oxoacid:acceptor oxidoreductase family protein n=1 Tax=Zhaonella formicivorans TaxID=2528593 RepID=UPI0010E4379A|nr:2-oxoacid:acceptor oxidoreductase family protein [Zhaonella formicivorans]
MLEKVILAGHGGQGVLFAGKLLAYAGMLAGKEVAWFPAYGPEMRGGTAYCTVVLSDSVIASPVVDEPDSALILNQASLEKFLPKIKSNGLLFANSSVVSNKNSRNDLFSYWIDAQTIAESIGNGKVTNLVMLGAYLQKKALLDWDAIIKGLSTLLRGKSEELFQLNLKALEQGKKLTM